VEIQVYRPGELTAADREAWSSFQAKAHLHGLSQLADPFLAHEFALAVGRSRGGVRIAVCRDADGEPAAFLPYQRGALGVGQAIGLGLSDCQGVVHRPGFTWDAAELLRACGLSMWEFDHLVDGQQAFVPGVTGSFGSPVIDLDQGYDAYLAHLRERSASLVRGIRYKERKLGREVGEVRYVHDERDPAVLHTLMSWKSAQYRRTGRADRFAKRWIVSLMDQLFHSRSDSFAGQLSVLYAGERPVAAHFGLRTERVLTCWFPAYDPDFGRYSPGMATFLHVAAASAAEGLSYLDLGRGQKHYKDSLKTRELTVHEGWVTRPHPVALVRRAQRAPLRGLRNTVQARPALFGPADRLLKRLGSIRSGRR
jgi:CelD/BcsL family acetyltransferase involved in cellulose biosynthesis